MRLDLIALSESPIMKDVIYLVTNGQFSESRYNLYASETTLKVNGGGEFYIEWGRRYAIPEELQVSVLGRLTDVPCANVEHLIELLHPFDLDDRIEDFGKWLVEEYSAKRDEGDGWEIGKYSIEIEETGVPKRKTLRIYEGSVIFEPECGDVDIEYDHVRYKEVPTSKRFASQLLEWIGIKKGENK